LSLNWSTALARAACSAVYCVVVLWAITEPTLAQPSAGDIEFQKIEPTLSDYGYVSKDHLWNDRVVRVCWENPPVQDKDGLLAVERAVEDSWERAANISFTGWQLCRINDPGIRIFLIDEAYPPRSLIGNRLDGVHRGMRLNLTFQKWGHSSCRERRLQCIRTEAMDAFGHALGLIHESLRPDAPPDCKASQAVSGDDSNPGNGEAKTPYDSASIMNYCNFIYGKQAELSELDIKAVQLLYPR
jgi:hypothetical protein